MVLIVDGEILQDDDPRLRAPRASPARPDPSGRPSQPAAPANTPTFDWSAPPVRVAYEAPEESFYGMPGLDFFGAHFASKHLVALAGVTVFFSWRGFLVGCIAWAVYKCNIGIAAQQAAAGAAAGSSSAQQGAGQGIASTVSTLFSTPPTGRQEYKSGQSAGPAPRGNASTSQSGWSAPGRGHKLGS